MSGTPLIRTVGSNPSGAWAQARSRLGLGDYTFHSLRKTVATALDLAGLSPRDIADVSRPR